MWGRLDLGSIGRPVVAVLPKTRATVSAVHALFQKRLLFLVGKGGVGKTTIATALALAVSRQGKKTLLIELDDNTRAARLLGLPPLSEPTAVPRQVSPTLFVLMASGQAALKEYLQLTLPVKRLLRAIFASPLYQYFVAAAPGLKELLTIGKIWYEERRRDGGTQASRWDILIVDTPATGHSIQYLRMPRAARDTFGSGLVHREAERVWTLLTDPEKTAINLVTTPEELPVSETQEIYQQLTTDLRVPLGMLFVNRVHQTPIARSVLEHAHVKANALSQHRRLAEQLLACARTEAALEEAQAPYLQQLQQLPLPTLYLPFCYAEEFGLAEVARLSRIIATTPSDRQARKAKPYVKRETGKG